LSRSADQISIEVSPGELIDRITILEIKFQRMQDQEKRARVSKQLAVLKNVRTVSPAVNLDLSKETIELRAVNEKLWDVEDRLRRCESEGNFDSHFIELARQVYLTNDRRAALKRLIDQRCGSQLLEEKEYVEYPNPVEANSEELEHEDSGDFQSEMRAGNSSYELGDIATAELHYGRAAELDPASVEANYNWGVALAGLEQTDEAQKQFRRTLELNPLVARAWNFLGVVEAMCEQYESAEAHYRQALELEYEFPDAHFNLGQLLLRTGRLQEGFAESEWRWRTSQFTPLECVQPRWDGTRFDGALMVHTEQGAGDAMQFVRYLPLAAERCGRLILVCTDNLAPLFESVPGIDQIRGTGTMSNSEFQSWLPLMSLPYVFGTTLDSIPSDIPYLAPPDDRANVELGPSHVAGARLRVGISWAGSVTHKNDRHRSCALSEFTPVLDVPDVAFYSLQVGPRAIEINELGERSRLVEDLSDRQRDFSDTALIMKQLDLVISVDTAVLHLAGALGRPAWGLLSTRCDWRWLVDRIDTPWYPTLRLFRQEKLDNWPELMQRVAEALSELSS